MSQKYPRIYAVVSFLNEKGQRLMLIDLVPGSWVTLLEDGTYLCKYPPKQYYHKLEEWRIKKLKGPDPSWKSFKVTIVTGADTLEQGKRRCTKACKDADCASTDTEKTKNPEPPLLSDAEMNQMLKKTVSVRESAGATSTIQGHGGTKKKTPTPNPLVSSEKKSKPYRTPIYTSSSGDDSTYRSNKSVKSGAISLSDAEVSTHTLSHSPAVSSENSSDNSFTNKKFDDKDKGNNNDRRSMIDSDESSKSATSRRPLQTPKRPPNKTCTRIREPELINPEDSWMNYMKERFDKLEQQVRKSNRSILYDIKTRINAVNINIAAIKGSAVPLDMTRIHKTLQTTFPLTELEDFLAFDVDLSLNEDKRNALVNLFKHQTYNYSTATDCICHALPLIIDKRVQSKFSGQGQKKGQHLKLSFKETATYSCFEVAMREKFAGTDVSQKLISKVGTWLAHWKDREGGRRQR